MSLKEHYQIVCEEHGTVYSQCRCASPDKVRRKVACNLDVCAVRGYAFTDSNQALTFTDWLLQAIKGYAISQPNYERYGQFLFNDLDKLRPDITREVHGVPDLDPFHVDANVPTFLDFVARNWKVEDYHERDGR